MNKNHGNFILYVVLCLLVVMTWLPRVVFASEGGKNIIPDGENLLLRPKVGKIVYEYDIYTLSENGRLYHSLVDVIDILELMIDFDETTGKGQGWFLREDWKISIDLLSQKIISKNKTYSLDEKDTIIRDDVIFVSQQVLAQWFDMTFQTDLAQQYLEIITPYPLPGVARYYRQKKKNRSNKSSLSARFPRHETQYDWFDINTADVRVRTRYRRYGDVDPILYHSGSLAVEGQLLKHEAYALANADDRNNLTSVVARLSKNNENPVLFGPLKARSYTIGDTTITDVPLTGDTAQELGFHIGSSVNGQVQFQTTDIDGDALPGWDVELYRNGILVSSFIVGNDGFYEFPDIQLFGGNNEFELFFYGPQGEIRNREINVPVTATLLAAQSGTYDVSVSLSDTRTFQKNKVDDVDRETLHIAARYNKSFGNTLAYLGLRNRDIGGENKTFAATGFTSLIKNTIVDGNIAVDDDVNVAGEVVVRKNIYDWNVSIKSLMQSEGYQVDDNTNPKVLNMAANVQRTFSPVRGTRTSLFLESSYSETANDIKQSTSRLGASFQKGRLNFSNSMLYENVDSLDGDVPERLENTFSMRANYGKYFFRGGVDYDIKPISQVDRYFSQVNYYPNARLSGDLRLDHEPDRDFTEMRLGMTYTGDRYRASPFVEWDNQDELVLGLSLNFNIVDPPYKKDPIVTSDRSIGRGLVSSFVFHDENGNNVFDRGEPALPDVVVESVNVKRRAQTNENGYSLIKNLPAGHATDIQLNQYSLPDPYMLSSVEGVSVFPSAGEIVDLTFPVHMSGEVDGTISVRDETGGLTPLKRADLMLYPIGKEKDKEIKVETAFDGFYVASQIPPGKYLMSVTNETAKRVKASLPSPRFVDIGYEGSTLYGYNFELDKGLVNVPIDIVYGQGNATEVTYHLKTRKQQQNSKLLNLIGQLHARQGSENILSGLRQAGVSDDGSQMYKLPNGDLEASHNKCRELSLGAIPCTLQIQMPSEVEPLKTAQTSLR